MCGRYSIYESMDHYLKELAPQQLIINGYDLWPIERYNVAPTARVELIHPVPSGLRVDKVRWGWSPQWAKGNRPDPINARVETAMSGRFFKDLWPSGRVLAPASGWFEWVKDASDPKKKQPYFIRSKDKRPLFFAALGQVRSAGASEENDGFVIVTTASGQEMIGLHERCPVVLTPAHAREWIDPSTSPQRAAQLVRDGCRPAEDFTWHAVSQEVGNVRRDHAALIEPEQ